MTAVGRLGHDPALRRSLVEGGLKTAARFTVDRQAEELERIHRAAAAGPLPA